MIYGVLSKDWLYDQYMGSFCNHSFVCVCVFWQCDFHIDISLNHTTHLEEFSPNHAQQGASKQGFQYQGPTHMYKFCWVWPKKASKYSTALNRSGWFCLPLR